MVFSELDVNILSYGVGLYITSRCNLECKHCYVGDLLPDKDLDFGLFQRAFQDYFNRTGKKLPQIIISGGESTLHPDFKKFVLFASRVADLVLINTNGTTLPLDYEVLKKKYSYLPENVSFQLSFDNFHYESVAESQRPNYEQRILNLINFCIERNILLQLRSVRVDGYRLSPEIANPELKKVLKDLYYGKPKRISFITSSSHKLGRAIKLKNVPIPDKKDVYYGLNGGFEILPSGMILSSEHGLSGELNKDNLSYIGDLNLESFESVLERFKMRLLSQTPAKFWNIIRAVEFSGRPLSLAEEKILELLKKERLVDRMTKRHLDRVLWTYYKPKPK